MSSALPTASSSPGSSKGAAKSVRSAPSAHPHSHSRRTRLVRRRGRGRLDGIESDEEIERDAMSDASDSDAPSLVDSASDSDPESDAESVLLRNRRLRPDTPSTTQSPPPGEVDAAVAINGFAVSKPAPEPELASVSLEPPRSAPAFLSAGVNWSDMVADEGVNGAAALPVIDFADLHQHQHARGESPPTITKQQEDAAPAISGDGKEDDAGSLQETDRPHSANGDARPASRQPGQTARQAYQHRLQTDPSFVPVVGEFWGHDDRLMQKDLRSLSGWWRGRWQGRGRGRGGFVGRGMGPRGRGRGGGFYGGSGPTQHDGQDAPQAESLQSNENDATPPPEPERPPIDKAWTHDGFEEMKAKDDRRRATEQQQQQQRSPAPHAAPNGGSFRGNGGFVPRGGRASFAPGRGAYAGSPTRGGRAGAPFLHAHPRTQPDRPWYAMKPERVWTKQFEGFLHLDPALKPKPGRGAGFRVRLPGKGVEVVRAPAPPPAPRDGHSRASSEAALTTENGAGKKVVVKVPKRAGKEKAAEDTVSQVVVSPPPPAQPESFTTVEELRDEPPAAAPAVEVAAQVSVSLAAAVPPASPTVIDDSHPVARDDVMATPSLTRDNSLSDKSVIDKSVIDNPPTVPAPPASLSFSGSSKGSPIEFVPAAAPPPPLVQPLFPPPSSPPYGPGSPYGAYAPPPPLPPGIALNQQGFAFELASGRPVYLHATPPPPPMPLYNPRPMPFVPGHMHHLSGAEFMQQQQQQQPMPPQTPPTQPALVGGIVDPTTGQPLFALPRQNSRIEIRAPPPGDHAAPGKPERRPSGLRSAVSLAESAPAPAYPPPGLARFASAPEFYPDGAARTYAPSVSPGSEGPAALDPGMPGMMGYGGYQQQQAYYYPEYPEQYYPAYVEMAPPPNGQYDAYQPPVYY
ncbi:hypothetical protein DFH11DRAFT_1723530 [Phellopilus nigrolimitatus]|nr:hypothetical protein DFH11DRAFT_1723530 [Phellopilus nigrolimitatus]